MLCVALCLRGLEWLLNSLELGRIEAFTTLTLPMELTTRIGATITTPLGGDWGDSSLSG